MDRTDRKRRPTRMLVIVIVPVLMRDPPQAPEPDTDDHQADDPLAPQPERLEREQGAEGQEQEPDQPHAAGVAEAPSQAGSPRRATRARRGRERSDRSQVVGAADHVPSTEQETSQRDEHQESAFDRRLISEAA